MENIIQCKIINLVGEPGYGKSFLCLFLALHYRNTNRVFSNINFYYKGKKFSRDLRGISDVGKITYDKYKDKPGLVIIDEAGINANARRSMTSDNFEIVTELGALARKKNVNVVYCSQLVRMLDVYLREMAFMRIQLKKPYFEKGVLVFNADLYKKEYLIGYREFRLFALLEMGYYFNTLETSIMKKMKAEKQAKEENNKLEFTI